MHTLHKVSFFGRVFSGASTDGTDLDIGVIRIGVLHFVMRARGESIIITRCARAADADSLQFRGAQRAVVIAHMKGMRMFERGMRGIDPRLQMLDPNLMIASF